MSTTPGRKLSTCWRIRPMPIICDGRSPRRTPATFRSGNCSNMKVGFTPSAWENYLWSQDHDRKLLKRINLLIKDILRAPLHGEAVPVYRRFRGQGRLVP